MKKLIVILTVMFSSLNIFGTAPAGGCDTCAIINGAYVKIGQLQHKVDSINMQKAIEQLELNAQNKCTNTWISLALILLFLVVLIVITIILCNGKYKLGDALKENIPVTISQDANPSATRTTLPNSSSRVIAFLTGITTLVILVCLTTFWIYKDFISLQPVDFSTLTTLFVTLGLGIVPYGTNKLTSMFNSPNTANNNLQTPQPPLAENQGKAVLKKHTNAGKFKYKLGKSAAKRDLRTLKFSKYILKAQLPQIPASKQWGSQIPPNWGMMDNDTLGDCTCAAAGHMIMNWTGNVNINTLVTPTSDQILQAYEQITGYTPGNPSTDNGAACIDVLNYWRNTGIAGRTINSYVSVDYTSQNEIMQAVYLFGGCYIGMQLPNSLDDNASVWSVSVTGAVGNDVPNPNNGHCVNIVGYDANYLTIITWGMVKTMTWGFFAAYADEAYAVLSNDWFNISSGKAPDGFDMPTLQTDLNSITSAGN